MNLSYSTPLSIRLGRGLLAVFLLVGLCLGSGAGRAQAISDVFFFGCPGTGAPPATLGPFTMTPFGDDTRPTSETVTSVPGTTGDLLFNREAVHSEVGSGWGTWSHGYAGDVYYFQSMPVDPNAVAAAPADSVEITLPAGTMAFYLYVEPNDFGEHQVVVSASGATSGPVTVSGSSGATYFGFYSEGASLSTVIVEVDPEARGFAIGEFGIYGPVNASSPRADVSVVVYGGWGGMPVQAWVGGTAQPTLYSAPDEDGNGAVLWTFYPPEGAAWKVAVAPALPGGLDPAEWELKLVSIRRGTSWDFSPTVGEVTVGRGSQVGLYYQLMHK